MQDHHKPDEPSWRRARLSLERPYKDDNGLPIPVLLDIAADGEHDYEPDEDLSRKLGENFRRIFIERGTDFFDQSTSTSNDNSQLLPDSAASEPDRPQGDQEPTSDDHPTQMTPEALFKMRSDILPRLHIALGEMSHARDMLSLLLSAAKPSEPSPVPALPSGLLTASSVTKLPDVPSVQAFNARLVTGGKDEALRKASAILKHAADRIEHSASWSDKYWSNALSIRMANWGLLPAPLPIGTAVNKGSDRTSRDFLVSYGLEQSAPLFRRRAIAQMAHFESGSSTGPPLLFPARERTRLRVSLIRTTADGQSSRSHNQFFMASDKSLDDSISSAQKEVIEQEIFDQLIKEAGNLPTASARVSERLISVQAAQGAELVFDLVDQDIVESLISNDDNADSAVCDLIYWMLHVRLLRAHAYANAFRLNKTGSVRAAGASRPPANPLILQPILDVLQYHVFCERVKRELADTVNALSRVGVHAALRFDPVGDSGKEIVKVWSEDTLVRLGGESVLRIDDRHSVRFTFTSPSTLTAHLPQSTIGITSIPQLRQLLNDEVERSLLGRICDIGIEACENISGTWFVDEMMCRSVGRWEGCVLNFRVKCSDTLSVDCHAIRLIRKDTSSNSELLSYGARQDKSQGLFAWVRYIIEGTLTL